MRRFTLAVVVGLVFAGVFAVSSSGRSLDEQQRRKINARNMLQERIPIYNDIYETTRRMHEKGSASLSQLMDAQTSLYLAELDTCGTRPQRIDVLEKMLIGAKEIVKLSENGEHSDGQQRLDWLNAKARWLDAVIKLENEQADRGF